MPNIGLKAAKITFVWTDLGQSTQACSCLQMATDVLPQWYWSGQYMIGAICRRQSGYVYAEYRTCSLGCFRIQSVKASKILSHIGCKRSRSMQDY